MRNEGKINKTRKARSKEKREKKIERMTVKRRRGRGRLR